MTMSYNLEIFLLFLCFKVKEQKILCLYNLLFQWFLDKFVSACDEKLMYIDLRRNILDRNFKDNWIHIENIYETNSNVIVVFNKEHTQHAINYLS